MRFQILQFCEAFAAILALLRSEFFVEGRDVIVETLLRSVRLLTEVTLETAIVVSDVHVRVEVGQRKERFVTLETGEAPLATVYRRVLVQHALVRKTLVTRVTLEDAIVVTFLVSAQRTRCRTALVAGGTL